MLAVICFLFGTIWADSTASYEQLTMDYFFETIWKQEYGDYKSVEFNERTDTSIHVGHIYGCREWDVKVKMEIEKGVTKQQIQLDQPRTNVSIKRTSNSKRLKLFIGTRIQVGDTFVVEIEVYKPYEFVNHYFIKFDKNGNIMDTCAFGEII